MTIELEIPKIFAETIKLEDPEKVFEIVKEYESRKNPKNDNLDFKSAYLRKSTNNREVYYLETEGVGRYGAILIADVKHANEEKENVIYYVLAYALVGEGNRIVEPFSMKFFKTLSSACVYAKTITSEKYLPETSIKELDVQEHLKAIANSFTNNNIKVAFNSEVNFHINQLRKENAPYSDQDALIFAVNSAIRKEYFYLTPYVQSVNRCESLTEELNKTLHSLL